MTAKSTTTADGKVKDVPLDQVEAADLVFEGLALRRLILPHLAERAPRSLAGLSLRLCLGRYPAKTSPS